MGLKKKACGSPGRAPTPRQWFGAGRYRIRKPCLSDGKKKER